MQQQSLSLTIRPATEEDLPRILDIYAGARRRMAAGGNATQWGDHYPPADLLAEEIHAGCLYAIVGAGILRGVFSFRIGPDPTYARIGEGAWLSDTPYGTVHRLAGDGETHGIFAAAIAFCRGRISHLRIDTHENNRIMQKLITRSGFVRCGIIRTDDGTARIVYESLS